MKSKNSKTEPPDAYWAARIMGSQQEGKYKAKIQKILKLCFGTNIIV